LGWLPQGALIRVSGASQKSLFYEGGEDVNALKGKVLYVVEAAIIAAKGNQEHEFTQALRSLLSDNVLAYKFVDADTKQTVTLLKYGPVAVMLTTARENVEPELETRLLRSSADEAQSTTRLVQRSMALAAAGKRPTPKSCFSAETMRKLQQLLALRGPFDVEIPFAEEFVVAGHSVPAFVRARRDTGQVLAAIRASAILHYYQRQKTEDGKIIATVDDYRHAYTACASGMTAVYNPTASVEVVAFIKVLEKMRDEKRAEAQKARDAWLEENQKKSTADKAWEGHAPKVPENLTASYEQIRAAMGVPSKNTVADRVAKAISSGLLERGESNTNTGGRHRSEWVIKTSSTEALTEAKKIIALPTPEAVETLIKDPQAMKTARALYAAQEDPDAAEQGLRSAKEQEQRPHQTNTPEQGPCSTNDPEQSAEQRLRSAQNTKNTAFKETKTTNNLPMNDAFDLDRIINEHYKNPKK
jgi:hypothetical protein